MSGIDVLLSPSLPPFEKKRRLHRRLPRRALRLLVRLSQHAGVIAAKILGREDALEELKLDESRDGKGWEESLLKDAAEFDKRSKVIA